MRYKIGNYLISSMGMLGAVVSIDEERLCLLLSNGEKVEETESSVHPISITDEFLADNHWHKMANDYEWKYKGDDMSEDSYITHELDGSYSVNLCYGSNMVRKHNLLYVHELQNCKELLIC